MTAPSMVIVHNDSAGCVPVGVRTQEAPKVVSLDPGADYGPVNRGLLTDMTRNLVLRGTLSLRPAA